MKRNSVKRTLSMVLTAVMISSLLSSCKVNRKKDFSAKPEDDGEQYGMKYPETTDDPWTTTICLDSDFEGDLVAKGAYLYVHCYVDPDALPDDIDPTDKKDIPLKLYMFDWNEDYAWNKKAAIVKETGRLEFSGDDLVMYVYTFSLPKKANYGMYTIAMVREDGTVDCTYDFEVSKKARETEMPPTVAEKPVIYLYPEETMDISVRLDLQGELACSYPEYGNGWNVTASSDGKIYDKSSKRTYDYLFWEGRSALIPNDFKKSVCVASEDSAAFLEEYLTACGLNDREIDDFISYWLPRLQAHPYNLISFPTEEYSEIAGLDVIPKPDTVIRVYMVFKGLEEPVGISPENKLKIPSEKNRSGFTVVEWGGSEIQ